MADLIRDDPAALGRTYVFGKVGSWKEIGLQVLRRMGWRPDCTRAEERFLERLPPPPQKTGCPLLIGALAADSWLSIEEQHRLEREDWGPSNMLIIDIKVCKIWDFCATLSCMRMPDGKESVQCWFHGFHPGEGVPVFAREVAVAHALGLVDEFLQRGDPRVSQVRRIEVHAGDSVIGRRLHAWFARGEWGFKSEAGGRIAGLSWKVAAKLPCPLFFFCYEGGDPAERPPVDGIDTGWMTLEDTKERAKWLIQQGKLQQWRQRMARIPLTAEEIREAMRIRYETDELIGIGLLSNRGSWSAKGYIRLGLTRHIIREALSGLEGSRVLQTTLCGIICGTRFKYFEAGALLPTTCMRCGRIDGLEHLMGCVGLWPPEPSRDEAPMVEFLMELARRASRVHNGIPVPWREQTEGDLELSAGEASGGEDDDHEISLEL